MFLDRENCQEKTLVPHVGTEDFVFAASPVTSFSYFELRTSNLQLSQGVSSEAGGEASVVKPKTHNRQRMTNDGPLTLCLMSTGCCPNPFLVLLFRINGMIAFLTH
jgi:hypothetical protein